MKKKKKNLRTNSQKTGNDKREAYFEKLVRCQETLSPTFTPTLLPGREGEIAKIKTELRQSIKGFVSCSFFLYGSSGVGKTACMRKILHDFEEEKLTDIYEYVHVNGMEISTTKGVYEFIYKSLTGNEITSSSGIKSRIRSYLKKDKNERKAVLLFIDEIDALTNRNLPYQLFKFSYDFKGVCTIGLSNTMPYWGEYFTDDTDVIHFSYYKKADLRKIIDSRLENFSFFSKQGIDYGINQSLLTGDVGDARSVLSFLDKAIKAKKNELALLDNDNELQVREDERDGVKRKRVVDSSDEEQMREERKKKKKKRKVFSKIGVNEMRESMYFNINGLANLPFETRLFLKAIIEIYKRRRDAADGDKRELKESLTINSQDVMKKLDSVTVRRLDFNLYTMLAGLVDFNIDVDFSLSKTYPDLKLDGFVRSLGRYSKDIVCDQLERAHFKK